MNRLTHPPSAGGLVTLLRRAASVGLACMVSLTLVACDDDDPVATSPTQPSTSVTDPPTSTAVAPAFTAQPLDVTVAPGATATFSVAASGSPAPSLQWQASSDGGANWSNLAGATGSSYTTAATTLGDDQSQYRVVATNSAGSATSDAATLTVREAVASAWTAPANVGNGIEGVRYPDIGIDGSNNSFLTYSAIPTGADTRTYASVRAPGGAWSAPELIDGGLFPTLDNRIAASFVGQAVAVWRYTSSGGYNRIAASRFANGAWQAAQRVDVGSDTSQAWEPRVAIDDFGRAIVVWRVNGLDGSDLAYSIWNGASWSSPEIIATVQVGHPEVAVDGEGNGYVVWTRALQVWSAPVSLGAGTVGAASARSAVATDSPDGLRFEMARSGRGLLAWVVNRTLLAAAVDEGGWKAVETVKANIGVFGEQSGQQLALAVDGRGDAIVAWQDRSAGETVQSRRYTRAAGWGDTAQLSTPGVDWATGPRVGINLNGKAVVGWAQAATSGGLEEYWAAVYDGGAWGAGQRLQTPAFTVWGAHSAVGVTGTGESVAAWVVSDGPSDMQLFSSSSP